MLFVDASVFLAYDNTRDVHHEKAVLLWKDIEKGTYDYFFTSDYVFNEVVGVTFRKFGKERAVLRGDSILRSMSLLIIDEHMLQDAWKFFAQTQSTLNLVDCTHLSAMKVGRAQMIATYDEEFKNVKRVRVIQ